MNYFNLQEQKSMSIVQSRYQSFCGTILDFLARILRVRRKLQLYLTLRLLLKNRNTGEYVNLSLKIDALGSQYRLTLWPSPITTKECELRIMSVLIQEGHQPDNKNPQLDPP